MSLVLTALVVMAFSLALTAVSTYVMRRVARSRGDEEMLVRARFTGTARQRRTTMWMAAGLACWAVVAGLFGAAIATSLAALAIALVGQAMVLELIARRNGADDDAGAEGAA